jgi:hypothetical protein
LCSGAGFEVFFLGPSAAIPIRRISLCTRLRFTGACGVDSIWAIRREPRNGCCRNSLSMRRISARSSSSFAARCR